MKSLVTIIKESKMNKKDDVFAVDLSKYYGLEGWEIQNIEAKHIPGIELKNVYKDIISDEDKNSCILLNIDQPKFANKYQHYEIRKTKDYYIVRIKNRKQPSNEITFLAIDDGVIYSSINGK